MFAKPFKVKSNNTLKNSEKKHLIQRILDEFPGATEESAKLLVPLKGCCSCMKLVLHSGEAAEVFVSDGRPVLLATRDRVLPTVAALWLVPDLIPAITVQAPVLPKLQNGAPLYLPGVALPARGAGLPLFARGAPLAAATSDNGAAAAVGLAALASGDMLLRAGGVCMDIWHWTGDLLCRDPKLSRLERPRLPAPGAGDADRLAASLQQCHIQPAEAWPALGAPARPAPLARPAAPAAPAPPAPPAPPSPEVVEDNVDDSVMDESVPETEPAAPGDPDGLLVWALLSFLKLQAKSVELPLLSSLLYRNYLLPLCPPDRTMDVKKSSYKKVGKFLEAMQKEGLLEVREIEKGVDAVTALHAGHPRVRSHAPPSLPPLPAASGADDDEFEYTPPKVHEMFSLTAAVSDLFAPLNKYQSPKGVDAVTALHAGHPRVRSHAPPSLPPLPAANGTDDEFEYTPPKVHGMFSLTAAVSDLFASLKKGTTLTASEVRSTLTEYVKSRSLNAPRGTVALDAVLAYIVDKDVQENIKWDALMAGVQARLTPCTEMVFADGTRQLTKAKLEPIKMQVVNRSGNKKVTLVSNLEAFGFVLTELARAWQRGAAAAAGVTRAPGAKRDQLLLQGDQTYFVARTLVEKYGLPKKFVEGADKALKKKKG